MIKKILASLLFITLMSANSSYALQKATEKNDNDQSKSTKKADLTITNYVNDLLNKTFKILQDSSKTTDQKIDESEALLTANMDLEWMAKFTLGRYRRKIAQENPQLLKDFIEQYSLYVVKSYGNGVKNFKNQKVQIKSQQAISNIQVDGKEYKQYLVRTTLLRDGLQPLQMDYMVRETENGLKVFDVITEGISLVNSHQAEFGDTISSSSNGIETLLSKLKEKVKKLD